MATFARHRRLIARAGLPAVMLLCVLAVRAPSLIARPPAVTAAGQAACATLPEPSGAGTAILSPAGGATTSSRPAFCWQAAAPAPECFFVDVSPRAAGGGAAFAWWYRIPVPTTADGVQAPAIAAGPGRWQTVWGEGRFFFARPTQGSARPPFDRAPRVLPPGPYDWRVSVASSCSESPAATSDAGSFAVEDAWQELAQPFVGVFPRPGYYLNDLLPLTLDGGEYAAAALYPFVALDEQLTRNPALERIYTTTRPVLIQDVPSPTELVVLRREGGGAGEVFRRTAGSFVTVDHQLSGTDVNGDGRIELVVGYANPGNCSACGWVEVYQALDGVIRSLPMDLAPGWSPGALRDIDGDGVYEVVAVDYRFEVLFWCHACSPSSSPVLAWSGDRYVPAASRFPRFYADAITRERNVVAQARASGDMDQLTSAAVALLMNEALSGNADAGWAEYKAAVAPGIAPSGAGFTDWTESLPVLNVILARAYGFLGFDARSYLARATYPPALQATIADAIAKAFGEASPPTDFSPYLTAPSSAVIQLASEQLPNDDRIFVLYSPSLDFFLVSLTRRAAPDGSCQWADLEGRVAALLGVEGTDRLVIDTRRTCLRPTQG